ncbi:hypothetical protein L1049_008252 [Liquidambar formosana]|uniref:Uncharacterized protein n=1 Tax=Liquidambar formosana TaxID=63359 RepID=A0AAP0S3A1_LIQFO
MCFVKYGTQCCQHGHMLSVYRRILLQPVLQNSEKWLNAQFLRKRKLVVHCKLGYLLSTLLETGAELEMAPFLFVSFLFEWGGLGTGVIFRDKACRKECSGLSHFDHGTYPQYWERF